MAFNVSLRYDCLELIVDVVQCFTVNAQSVDYSLVRVLQSKTGKVCSDISPAYLLAPSMRCPKKDDVLCSAADRFRPTKSLEKHVSGCLNVVFQ